jgi:hypothetical protein
VLFPVYTKILKLVIGVTVSSWRVIHMPKTMLDIVDKFIEDVERERTEKARALYLAGFYKDLAPKYDFCIEKLKKLREELDNGSD